MRLISIILTAVLLITLAACGGASSSSAPSSVPSSVSSDSSKPQSKPDEGPAPNTAGFVIEFGDVKDGYLVHTSPTEWSVSPAEGFSCTGDFYTRLPAGTQLSSEKKFAFFCYDEGFSMDTELMEESGMRMIRMSAVMEAGSYTLKEDCFVRFSVNGKLSDIVINPPKEKESIIVSDCQTNLLYAPTLQKISAGLENRSSAVNYIFVTDIHFNNSTNAAGQALIDEMKAIVNLANSNDNIDFVVVGGDTTTGMFETKAQCVAATTEVLSPLKECKKPVFVLMGNHDDNSYHRFTYDVYYPERIISDKDWNDNIVDVFCPKDVKQDKNYANSKYFYYDLTDKKTRVICLDAMDYRAKYDQNGVIRELPIKDASASAHVSKYWSGCSWWGYSKPQLQWLTEQAMTAPKDWDYIFVSHMGIDRQTNAYGYTTLEGDTLRSIISSYNNHQYFSNENLSADFSSAKGKILTYHFGHIHRELTHYSKDLDLWQICTSTAGPSSSSGTPIEDSHITDKSLGWLTVDRVPGGPSGPCFDVISADRKSVIKLGFGAATDKEMKY